MTKKLIKHELFVLLCLLVSIEFVLVFKMLAIYTDTTEEATTVQIL